MGLNIDQIIEDILKAEGGYVNDPRDRGGETNFGITLAVARQNGFHGSMKDMPESFARLVYRKRYIEAPGFHLVLPISETIGAELVDTGVNMGPSVAGKFLQRALNVLSPHEIAVDGVVGQGTRKTLEAYLKRRSDDGESVLLKTLNCLQGARYIELAEARQQNKAFIFGWIRARVKI